jgi:hypothetical protein
MKKEDTKYCKDCRFYSKPICNDADEFTARKNTCKAWKVKKKEVGK